MGLNECYALVRTNILMRFPLPNVNTTFNLVSQEKSHKILVFGSDKSMSASVAKKSFKS